MPFSALISAGIEIVSNHYLKLDAASEQRQQPLNGKVIAIEIRPLPVVYFAIAPQQLDVLSVYDGKVDSQLALNITHLPQLQDPNRLPEMIRNGQMELTGDVQLMQQFGELFKQVNPEPEEKLARLIGDAPANLIFRALRAIALSLQSHLAAMQTHGSEVLLEEWQLGVSREEFNVFKSDVTAAEQSLNDLESRINRLAN